VGNYTLVNEKMTLKDIYFVLVISIIISYVTCQTITVSRKVNGDIITGDIPCVEHNGKVLDNSCICKKEGDVYGTFFTSCLYKDTILKTGKISQFTFK